MKDLKTFNNLEKLPLEKLAQLWLSQTEGQFEIEDFCFDKQLSFISDPHPFTTAVCSVRAGKTVACACDLISTARQRPEIVCLYITLSRSNAKKIVWPELIRINREFGLNAKVNETDLSLKFPNGSIIYCSGASDKTEVDKFRGLALALCYIDECQSFPSYIGELVDEVIAKRLFDYAGRLRLIGTPGPVPVGYFYDCAHSTKWSHHKWTMFDNPHLPKKSGLTHEQILQRELERKGVTKDDPSIQRECFGVWAYDPNSLVFRYDSDLNNYEELPSVEWNHIIGIDLGFDDADAIAVLSYSSKSPNAYLVYEDVEHHQGITLLADKISQLVRKFNPEKIVCDTGGLGKKVAEEISKRHGIPINAADKQRKFENIELLNDAMRTKRFYAKRTSRFAQDSKLVEWDKDAAKDQKLKIKDTFHSDITDAVLYAFRELYHWLYEKPIPKPLFGTKEWFKDQEDEMEKAAYNNALGDKEDKWGIDEII